MKGFDRTAKILEIWYWSGTFASYCYNKWFTNYVWVDLDDSFAEHNKNKFPNYNFLQWDINNFLSNWDKYDIIFMAHVFEHLNKDQADETVKLIYKSLNEWWVWINYMPNADSLRAPTLRYNDITHKTIYNANSFLQIILSNDINYSQINNKNTIAAVSKISRTMFKIIHPIFVLLTIIYYLWMWVMFPKIYSSEMLTIMKK